MMLTVNSLIAQRRFGIRVWLAATCIVVLGFSVAQGGETPASAPWRCRIGDGRTCGQADLSDPRSRQILVLSTAYPDSSADRFWRDFDVLVERMSGRAAGNAWSVQKRDKILYIGYFTGGGALGSSTATFGARIIKDPAGAAALVVRVEDVHRFVDEQQVNLPSLQPLGTAILFQSDALVTPMASPPSFSSRPYGIARLTSGHIHSEYIVTHELAHASLNFLDEYVAGGLEDINIRRLDVLTPRLVFGQRSRPRLGVYDYNLSEILAGNGSANLALRPDVTTVGTPGTEPQRFEYEGGLFFGRGTFHDAGSNLMNSNRVQRGPGDGFAYDHSPSQQQFIDTVFGDAPGRANDRIRNAGPVDGWPNAEASVDLLLYDADKNNSYHPTSHYQVQVGWFERGRDVQPRWRSETYTVPAAKQTADLPLLGDRPEEQLLLAVACRAGMTELSTQLNAREACDSESPAFPPTLRFYTPYEHATVPASQPFTRYWWRFQTNNGTQQSGWTGWSSFYRSF
jgi:hypothetical protein